MVENKVGTIKSLHPDWTDEQVDRVIEVYERDTTVAPTLGLFAQEVVNYGEYLGVVWKGMFLGIEKDGYAHT